MVGIPLIDGFVLGAKVPLDIRTVHKNVATALSEVGRSMRYIGLQMVILEDAGGIPDPKVYWFKNGTTDADLVPFQTDNTVVVGPTGPAGPTGPQGADGPTGPTGPAGATGPTGPAGTNGTNGVDGKDGINGTNGVDGKDGADGAPGANGKDGADGSTGPQGPAGPTGATGPQGEGATFALQGSVSNKTDLPNTSAAGDAYFVTETGSIFIASVPNATGNQWYELSGVQGPIGPTGATGATGATGPQGPQGPAGQDGKDGAPGTNGTNGKDGVNGVNGTNGRDGVDGANGATGPAGPQGADGPVGPTGATGPKGDEGPQGPIGLQGPKGEPGLEGPKGEDGSSVQIKYVVDTPAQRDAITPHPAIGEGVFVNEDGKLYVSTGTGYATGVEIRGPKGEIGKFKAQGPTAETVGGLAAGTDLGQEIDFQQVLTMMLYPYRAPRIISFNGNQLASVIREIGTSINITQLSAVIEKRTNPITSVTMKNVTTGTPYPPINVGAGESGTYSHSLNEPISVTTSYEVAVTDSNNSPVTQRITYNFVNAGYYGALDDDILTATKIKGLSNKILQISYNSTKVQFTTHDQHMVFAYPKSFGTLSEITATIGNMGLFDTFGSGPKNLVIDGVDYYVYITNGTNTASGYEITFKK